MLHSIKHKSLVFYSSADHFYNHAARFKIDFPAQATTGFNLFHDETHHSDQMRFYVSDFNVEV